MKVYDLVPDPEMSPIIGLLHATVHYNFQRLKRLIEASAFTHHEMNYRGENGDLNSIAQLLRHLAVVDLHWVYRLQSKSIPLELQEIFGPMYDDDGKLPLITDLSLEKLIEQYETVQEMLREVCLSKTDDHLSEVVPFENGNQATVQWAIWHIADHSRHHYSNIVQMKKMLRRENDEVPTSINKADCSLSGKGSQFGR